MMKSILHIVCLTATLNYYRTWSRKRIWTK